MGEVNILKSFGISVLKRSNSHNQRGIAIIWMVATMVIISTIGVAMVRIYSMATYEWRDINASGESRMLADSGYRFLASEYRGISDDKDKNELLEELNGKTFKLSNQTEGQFKLDISSYFYRVETDPGSGTALKLKFVGNAGFTVPDSGYLKVDGDDKTYQYSATPPETAGVYTFAMTEPVAPADEYTTVRPVFKTNINDVSEGGTLTLDSGLGAIFPDENGMFLIEKEKIKDNLPVKTTVPYRYEYKDGDQLINVRKGPSQSSFTAIDADSDALVEMAKLVSIDSTGAFGDIAARTQTYRLSLDHETFTSGLKSYWSFDNVTGRDVADDYGTSSGELEGGAITTSISKVGSALSLSGLSGDYVSTTFNPSVQIGTGRSFTIAFWAKPDDVNGFGFVVGGFDSSSGPTSYLFIGTWGGKWVWGLGDTIRIDNSPASPLPDVRDDDGDLAGDWQHVVFAYNVDVDPVTAGNQDDIIIYINGIRKYSLFDAEGSYYAGNGVLPNFYLSLGALSGTTGTFLNFAGLIDEVAVLDSALTVCEIDEIFHVPASVPCNVGCDAVAYYPFSGNANDESGPNWDGDPPDDNHGVVNGAVLTTDRFGCEEKAYLFDGSNDYIDGGNKTVLDINNEITISAWVYNYGGDGHIVNRGGGWSDPGYSLFWLSNNIRIELQKITPSVEKRIFDTPAPSINAWHHVAFTWKYASLTTPGTITTYIDGVPRGTSSFIGPIGNPLQNLNIGRNEKNAYYFNGMVDDVIIQNKALTASEILDYYNSTKP